MARPSFDKLEVRIGYQFRNAKLLREALTHSSYVKEKGGRGHDNERDEFLGDAVLNFVVTERLVEAFPDYDEGKLSLARSSLVSAAIWPKRPRALALGDYLRLGPGEEKTGGRKKPGILADAAEAFVAAVYRDGGIEAARGLVHRVILPADLEEGVEESLHAKLQGNPPGTSAGRPAICPARYLVVKESGLEHQKIFTVEVRAGDSIVAQGSGNSKKVAEQEAARRALIELAKKAEANGRALP